MSITGEAAISEISPSRPEPLSRRPDPPPRACLLWGAYNYRETVSPWFRSLFTASPQPELMAGTPWTFQAHGLLVLALLAVWPYTRLVHMFSAPVGYLVRPYVVYRSKEVAGPDTRRYARAWGAPVTLDRWS